MTEPPLFHRGALPRQWGSYRKTTLTRAVRIDGPFAVETREGYVTCQNGWLALDAHGWPYPIDAEEFAAIYEEAE